MYAENQSLPQKASMKLILEVNYNVLASIHEYKPVSGHSL
jgi:hypothetical protein